MLSKGEMLEKGTAVARALWHDHEVSQDEHTWGVTIRAGKRRFLIRDNNGKNDGRLLVTVPDSMYPEGFSRRPITQVTVAETRDPKDVAGDIQRRFYPLYDRLVEAIGEWQDQQERLRTIMTLTGQQLMQALPGSRERWPGEVEYRMFPVSGSATIVPDGSSVDLTLRVPAEIAVAIFELLDARNGE